MRPYLQDPDFTLYVGDARDVLAKLPSESVDCVVTSPPYFRLRDYGVEGQIGQEETVAEFVRELADVFVEAKRVLSRYGTLWLNLGDTYVNKALARVPDKVADALDEDGWLLRSEVIWSKPNPMPSPAADRPTIAHEYLFMFTHGGRYWWDAVAVAEPAKDWSRGGPGVGIQETDHYGNENGGNGGLSELAQRYKDGEVPLTRNVRSVWELPSVNYPGAHFATFTPALPEKCILASCPERVCTTCGDPSYPIVETISISREELPHEHPEWRPRRYEEGKAGDPQSPGSGQRFAVRKNVGWTDCGHGTWRSGVVLDPFLGSGTTAEVARRLGRHSVGIELNQAYADEHILPRMVQQRLAV